MRKFSIVVPVCNSKATLPAALDSVKNQTYCNWECICVDDGSADDSLHILKLYSQKDRRFKVYSQERRGVGAARNRGLDNVSGDWVLFLDADDLLRSDTLAVCDSVLNLSSNLDCVLFEGMKFADGTSFTWPSDDFDGTYRVVRISEAIPFCAYLGSFAYRAYRSSKIRVVRFPEFRLGEDRAFVADAMEQCDEIAVVKYICYGYRQRNDSAMHKKWGLQEFLDELKWRSHVQEVWRRSKKALDRRLSREYALAITEAFSFSFWKLSKEDRRIIMPQWMELLSAYSRCPSCPSLARVLMKINAFCRIQLMTWITFWVPYYLKLHGFHR